MKILVCADNAVSDKMIDACEVMLTVDKDKKGFIINRHTKLSYNFRLFPSIKSSHRHMSELKHILLAGDNDR